MSVARFLLFLAAFVSALVVFVIGRGWWDNQAEYVTSWVGLSLACGWAAFMLPPPRP